MITSSVAAVVAMAQTDKPDPETGFYDESCWSNPDRPEGMGPYLKSKTLAEKAAWEYLKEVTPDKRFELVTICPTLVEGPTLVPAGDGSSGYIKRFMDGSMTEIKPGHIGIVDVRDVAKMHLESVRRPDAAG